MTMRRKIGILRTRRMKIGNQMRTRRTMMNATMITMMIMIMIHVTIVMMTNGKGRRKGNYV